MESSHVSPAAGQVNGNGLFSWLGRLNWPFLFTILLGLASAYIMVCVISGFCQWSGISDLCAKTFDHVVINIFQPGKGY